MLLFFFKNKEHYPYYPFLSVALCRTKRLDKELFEDV